MLSIICSILVEYRFYKLLHNWRTQAKNQEPIHLWPDPLTNKRAQSRQNQHGSQARQPLGPTKQQQDLLEHGYPRYAKPSERCRVRNDNDY